MLRGQFRIDHDAKLVSQVIFLIKPAILCLVLALFVVTSNNQDLIDAIEAECIVAIRLEMIDEVVLALTTTN